MKERVFVKEIKERLSRPGIMQFFMILRNDSYRGFDKRIAVAIEVKKEVQRAPVEYHEEDVQAQKAPSMMQSMMELQPNDSDEEESEDETTASNTSNSQQPPQPSESKKDQ